MRIALISDVHSNLAALEAVLADARANGAQQYICAGDVVGFGPEPKACVDLVRGMCQVVVSGNADRALGAGEDPRVSPDLAGLARVAEELGRAQLEPGDVSWLRGLGHEAGLYLSGRELYIVHGSPWDPLFTGVRPDADPDKLRMGFMTIDADFIVLGHTHRQMVLRDVLERSVLINPGTVGFPLDGDPRAAYSLLDTEDGSVHPRRLPYEVDRTVGALAAFPQRERELATHVLSHGRKP